jgi:hypothetical protein
MSSLAKLFAQGISETPVGLAGDINTWLGTVGPIGIQSVLTTRRVRAPGPRLSITVLYVPGAGTTAFGCTAFIGTAASSSASQLTAFLAAHPTYRGHILRDIGDQRRGKLDNDVLMLIYAVSALPNCGWDRSQAIVVQSTAIIAPGASGAAVRISGAGVQEAITITNRSTMSWVLGAYGIGYPRSGTCTWDAVPNCCGA